MTSYIDKTLATLKRRWIINCKKQLEFDKTIELTFVDMEKFYKKYPLDIMSKFSYQLVYENTIFRDRQKTQKAISEIEFKQTVKNIFKNGLEKCHDIEIILDLIEIAIDTKFMFVSEQNQKPIKGFTIKSI